MYFKGKRIVSSIKEVVIVTGMSGAGRSTVCRAFEDLGWFVIDNFPGQIIQPLIELLKKTDNSLPKIVLAADVRGVALMDAFAELVQKLRETSNLKILFIDATDAVLVRRYEHSRRPHPLAVGAGLLLGIQKEREILRDVRESADTIIDTTELSVRDLNLRIQQRFSTLDATCFTLSFMSFGYKYGIPQDSDIVMDMRFLPNPFWKAELRMLNGRDKQVSDYVLSQELTASFLSSFTTLMTDMLKGFKEQNKNTAMIAIGCTGGKHRSVAIVEELASRFKNIDHLNVNLHHRDLGRE